MVELDPNLYILAFLLKHLNNEYLLFLIYIYIKFVIPKPGSAFSSMDFLELAFKIHLSLS